MSELKPCQMTSEEAACCLEKRMTRYHPNDAITEATKMAISALRRAQPTNDRFADCHIWEPGDKLETIVDECEVLIKAADIKSLIAQPANEPLTCEGCVDFDVSDEYYTHCKICKRLTRVNDYYRRQPKRRKINDK